MFTVALACKLRLTWFMKCKQQNDIIENNLKDKTEVEILLNLVGKSNIFLFFQTAYALQCDISKQLGFKKKHFYTKPSILTCNLHLVFGNMKEINLVQIDYKKANPRASNYLQNFDEVMKQFENKEKTIKFVLDYDADKSLTITLHNIGHNLLKMNKPNEAFYYLKQVIKT